MKKFLFGVLVVVASVFTSFPVHAAPNQGPNPSDFTEATAYGNDWAGYGRRVDFVVATSIYNYIPTTRVKIYLPTPTGQVTVNNKDICYGTFRNNGNNYDNPDDGNILGSSGPAVSFDIPGGGPTQWGWWNGAAGCDNGSLTFNLSGASLDPNTNMYLYILTATANPSNARYMNTFWVMGPAGSIISQDSSLSATSGFGMNQAYPMINGNNPSNTQFPPAPYRNYTNWSIKFAPDCTVTTPTVSRVIETYDDDNLAASSSDNWAVQPRRFSMRLTEYNRAGVFQGYLVPSAPIGFPDGSGGAIDLGSGFYEVYTSGNNKRAQITYTFKRDMIYSWDLYNVYIDNTLQFRVPFDSVYYYKECALPKAKLKAAMGATPSGVMAVDETATFSPSLIISGYNGIPFDVNCTIQRTLYPPGGGSTNLGAQPCTTPGGSTTIPINSGTTPVALRTNTYSSASLTAGTRICDVITITTPSDPGYFAVAGDNTASGCVIVGKTPYVHFMGGDVWAGGAFKVGTTCSVTSNNITTSSRTMSSGGAAGSMVEYAAFAQGSMTQFGSASRALLAGAALGDLARSLSFANNTGTPGNFAAPVRCLDDFAGKYAGVTAVCPGSINVASPPPSPCRTAGNLTLSTGTVQVGSRQVYIVDGNVSITGSGNLTYPSSHASVNDIPSVVVIATGDIRVNGSVRRLDGIYVTKGTFFTCQEKPALPSATCDQTLVVNGSVIAKNIDLYRTAGAEGSTATARRSPAETFHLRPEVFLRNSLNDTTKTVITTSETRELPPRF